MKKTTKRLIALVLGTSLVFCTSLFTFAGNTFQSTGRFEYKSDPSSSEADVVLDSSDLNTIYEEVSVGRGGIATAINNTGYGKLSGTQYTANDSFTSLKEAVENQFTIPANGGSSEVYYKTSGGELTTDKTLAADYDSGADTATELTLANATASSLSAGTMAWDNEGNLIIGTGADNKSYYEEGYNKSAEEMIDKLLTLQCTVNVPVANSIFDKTPATGTFQVRYGIDGVGTTTWTGSIGQNSGSYGTQTRITSAQFTILGKNKYRCVMYGLMSQSGWADGYEDFGNEVSFTYTTVYNNGTATWSLSSSRLINSSTVKGNNNDHYFYIKGGPTWIVPDWN